MNSIIHGDCLDVMRGMDAASVDLVYADPPYCTGRDFGAFDDRWPSREVYLAFMRERLAEIHRLLRPHGSVYLHCDPSISHHLRFLLDDVFGERNFRNEIVWKRTSAHSDAKRYGSITDSIYFFTVSDDFTWNKQHTPYSERYIREFFVHCDDQGRFKRQTLSGPGSVNLFSSEGLVKRGASNGRSGLAWRGYNPSDSGRYWAVPKRIVRKLGGEEALSWTTIERLELLDKHGYIFWPKNGRVPRYKAYLADMPGRVLQSLWDDIRGLSGSNNERTGYPTQKPVALLKRIIAASSNPDDVVLDPFCGSGTTLVAAHATGRKWIGIDTNADALEIARGRLAETTGALF